MTSSVWTVPATSVTDRLVFAVGPVAVMVQVPAGMDAGGLTEPVGALVVMLPAAPGAQLQWNVTCLWLVESWITSTWEWPAGGAWPAGGVRMSSRDSSRGCPAGDVRTTTVYA